MEQQQTIREKVDELQQSVQSFFHALLIGDLAGSVARSRALSLWHGAWQLLDCMPKEKTIKEAMVFRDLCGLIVRLRGVLGSEVLAPPSGQKNDHTTP